MTAAETKRIAVFDCKTAGISGDMFLGALLDTGADEAKTVEAIRSVGKFMKGCRSIEVDVKDVGRCGFRAKKVNVKVDGEAHELAASKLEGAVQDIVRSLDLSDAACEYAGRVARVLVEAEAKVHGVNVEKLHLHELGSVDTVADLVGAATALEALGLFKDTEVYSTPVAVGGGNISFSHGEIAGPAYAAAEILRLKKFTLIWSPLEAELTTPTGATLLVNIAEPCLPFHLPMKLGKIGYGAGTTDFKGTPNILRLILGEKQGSLLMDEILVLETNLDDVSGELIGHVTEKLLNEGAKDVCVIPMFTKKSRPGYIVKAMADAELAGHLSSVLMRETGTLGVRMTTCRRQTLIREDINVDVTVGNLRRNVRVKVAKDSDGNVIQIKPEFDDVKKFSEDAGRPLREIVDLSVQRAKQILRK